TPTTATPLAVFEVLQTTPFAAAVVASGAYSVVPGTTQAATTSVAGTGATFTPPYGNLPLYGNVTGIGTSGANGTVTIDQVCIACGAAGTQWWAIAHDNAPGITAGFSSPGVSGIYLPATQGTSWSVGEAMQWGIFTQLNLPNTREFIFACGGQSINALQPLNAMMSIAFSSSTGTWGLPSNNDVDSCYMEGMGIVNYAMYQAAGYWRFSQNIFRDATVADFWIGDGTDNAQGNTLLANSFHNDISLVPEGTSYGIYINGSSDNIINGAQIDGCIWSCLSFNAGGGYFTNIHAFLSYGGPTFQFIGNKVIASVMVADSPPPGTPAFYLQGGSTVLTNWNANVNSALLYNGQIGVYLSTDNGISVGCGTVGSTSTFWAAGYSNIVVDGSAGSN